MKKLISINQACLIAVTLMTAGNVTIAFAAAPPALQGQVTLRPLTPSEISLYGLPASSETSGGLSAVGVGQPAYLDALVNVAIAPSNILSVTWTLTNKPVGSAAVMQPSPLGTNVPPYNMADRYNQKGAPVYQVAGRALLRPDVTGQYTVLATITTTTSGTTNLAQNISAGVYLGIQVCEFCHSGSVAAPNVYVPWSKTLHASMFSRGIDGLLSPHYSKNCLQCHTVGYDTNALAVNGGFDDIATQLGWTFPTNLVVGNWASMQTNYPTLANVANIQCENCHGPGSEHAYAFGNTNLANWPRIGVTYWRAIAANATTSHPLNTKAPNGTIPFTPGRHALLPVRGAKPAPAVTPPAALPAMQPLWAPPTSTPPTTLTQLTPPSPARRATIRMMPRIRISCAPAPIASCSPTVLPWSRTPVLARSV